jgi:hypothetical protein
LGATVGELDAHAGNVEIVEKNRVRSKMLAFMEIFAKAISKKIDRDGYSPFPL